MFGEWGGIKSKFKIKKLLPLASYLLPDFPITNHQSPITNHIPFEGRINRLMRQKIKMAVLKDGKIRYVINTISSPSYST
jgi:hypothetical protein